MSKLILNFLVYILHVHCSAPALHASEALHDQSEMNLTSLATGSSPKHSEMNIIPPAFLMGVRVKTGRDGKKTFECHELYSNQISAATWVDEQLEYETHDWAAVCTFVFAAVFLIVVFFIERRSNGQMNSNDQPEVRVAPQGQRMS